ncbi:MAG: hypothetical protein J6D15_04850 [Clostridia bacterium]|nr:hypothetical protein [Clostridia bacterium]
MKKILSIILIIALVLSFVACGKKANDETVKDPDSILETVTTEDESVEPLDKEESSDNKKDEANENKPVSKPAEEKPQTKPEAKPEERPQAKPEVKPETTPEVTPEKEPEKAPESATLGNTLLADFKKKVNSGMDALSIAEALVTSPVIKFSGGAMPIEEGLLSGFGNTEIKGFKSGAMFAPMIGSIPFVGYIFELSDGTDASSFIGTLKSNADLRWNICVAADEMVTGSVGNKVFFVMCPTSLED